MIICKRYSVAASFVVCVRIFVVVSFFCNIASELRENEIFTPGADKSLARPTSRCIFFYGENISFDASLAIFINSTNVPPIMIINRIYETQNLLTL
jgi:hypothetical protein